MQFRTLLALTAAVAFTGVAAAPTKRADAGPLPTKATIYLQTTDGLTLSVLTEAGQAWQWADENGGGPAAGQYDVALVPGSLLPSGDDALVHLSVADKTCRIVSDFFDCTDADTTAPVATLRAKVKTDAVGETRWFLLGGYSAFSTKQIDQELNSFSPKPDYGIPLNAYLTPA